MADTWFLCAAGKTMFAQLDKQFPHRDHASDGSIGDASHAAVVSDHNPCWTCGGDSHGVVRAIDLDEDFLGAAQPDPIIANKFADELIELCRSGKERRVSYVIFEGKIASGTYPAEYWTWRPYSGTPDPHTFHIHISFMPSGDFDGKPFELPMFTEEVVTNQDKKDIVQMLLDEPLFGDKATADLKGVTVRDALRKAYKAGVA